MTLKYKKGYLWVTLSIFAISFIIHWVFAWFAYVQDQHEHNQPVEFNNYLNLTLRDTRELAV